MIFFKTTLSSLTENSGCFTQVRNSSRKSSATHSYQCVQYFRGSRQCYDWQCLGFLTCAQMLMHATSHGGYTDTVRQYALEVDWEKSPLPHLGHERETVLRLAFQWDALTTELFLPMYT